MIKFSVIPAVLLAVLFAALVPGTAAAQDAGPLYLSPVALVADSAGAKLFVAEYAANRIAVFDVATKSVEREISVAKPPTGLALSPDGTRLYVTCGGPDGEVAVIEVASGNQAAVIPAGHTPISPVLSGDGARLYFCNRFNNEVVAVDLANGQKIFGVSMPREPFAAALTPDGHWLCVANHLPAGPADGEYTAATVSIVDAAAGTEAGRITLPNGCTGLRGICVSPDGKYAYATHLLSRYHLPTTQLERGWMNTNALSVIDIEKKELVNTVLLDSVDLGAANPWGVACSADGQWLCVAHAGTHELSVIDRPALHTKLDRVAAGERVSEVSQTKDDVPNDLAFLVDLRRRIALKGNGPRGVALIGTQAFAAEYFTDSIGTVSIAPAPRARAESLPLGPVRELTVVRKGELFFNDAALCFQHWQSCASCHPDGRVDGLNWDLMNDGLGNPKNTKNMLLSHVTPPAMSLGVRDTAEMAVRSGIKYIQFAVRPEEDAVAIDEYMKAMKPEPSPYLVNGQLSESAVRGKEVFERAACAQCHSGPHYTDLKQYDVGTATGRDAGQPVDTPALIEAWRTAPYLHDGRSAMMEEVLTKHNPGDVHGTTSPLSADELRDLAVFLLSL